MVEIRHNIIAIAAATSYRVDCAAASTLLVSNEPARALADGWQVALRGRDTGPPGG